MTTKTPPDMPPWPPRDSGHAHVPHPGFDCTCDISAKAKAWDSGNVVELDFAQRHQVFCGFCEEWEAFQQSGVCPECSPNEKSLRGAAEVREAVLALAWQEARWEDEWIRVDEAEKDDPLWALLDKLFTPDQLASRPAPVPLVEGTLFRDTLCTLAGAPGSGKSFVALALALCVATGTGWLGRAVTQGPVIYVAAEGVSGLSKRIEAWKLAHGVTSTPNIHIFDGSHDLTSAIATRHFARLCKDVRPALIVLDTLSRCLVGADENSAQEMTKAIDNADTLRRASGCTVLLIHHMTKSGGELRGSGSLLGAMDTVYTLTAEGAERAKLKRIKSKDSEQEDVLRLHKTPFGESIVLSLAADVPTPANAGRTAELLEIMRTHFGTVPVSGAELFKTSGMPRSTFYRAREELLKQGRLLPTGPISRPYFALVEINE